MKTARHGCSAFTTRRRRRSCSTPMFRKGTRREVSRASPPERSRNMPPSRRNRWSITKQASRPHCRSEEHTSELQSLMRISYAVFCLKKKTRQNQKNNNNTYYHTTTMQKKH